MSPSRQDDFDWLYGQQNSSQPPPEPTRVLPPAWTSDGSPVSPDPSPSPRSPVARDPRPPTDPGSPAAGPVPPGEWPAAPSPYAAGLPGQGGPEGSGRSVGPPPRRPRRRRPVRTVLTVLAAIVLVSLTAALAVPLYAWSQVARTAYAPSGSRPADQPGTTFLLVGSDSREGLSRAQRKRLGTGSTAGRRTDTIMLMHIPRTGRPALVSVPRDSYVPIPDSGRNRINAAYAFGGPRLLVGTVEQSTGLRVDAYMEIGFGGFVGIIDSLGGIRMCLPRAIRDRDSNLNLKKGCQTLDGADALGYVRMRKADPLGDLGRVQRQRQMLAAVADKAASPSTVLNPVRYWRLNNATAGAVTVGRDTSLLQAGSLAWAMKRIAAGDGVTLTVPVADNDAATSVGSAVLWDSARARAMFAELARGDTSGLDKYAK